MSGGTWEYMANYLGSITENQFVSKFLTIESKYQTPYAGIGATSSTEDRTLNYEINKEKYGDAIWETSNGCDGQHSWNADYSHFPFASYPFFMRGGNCHDGSNAGPFCFGSGIGWGHNYCSLRVVLF